MNCHSTIMVLEMLESTAIHTREAAISLLQVAEKDACDQIDLDFSGIEFISRSFADQFHADKIKLCVGTGKNIIVTNANESVITMLQAVSKTQNKAVRQFVNVPIYKYSDRNHLERFLLSF